MTIGEAVVSNPKRCADELAGREGRVFPYYAGYSHAFAKRLLGSVFRGRQAVVLDPWNGAGTTTRAAAELGLHAIGCDLNPAMILIAKAELVSPLEAPALRPLAAQICGNAALTCHLDVDVDDPLCTWLVPSSAGVVRALERVICQTLVPNGKTTRILVETDSDGVAPIAALMYVALFRAVRRLTQRYLGTNPTWTKRPVSLARRIRPDWQHVESSFMAEIDLLASSVSVRATPNINDGPSTTRLLCADSRALPIEECSIDWILTSPPYCTRIDYAVATSIELSILGASTQEIEALRRRLLGTSTVPSIIGDELEGLGRTARIFLSAVRAHPSKASAGYYYKSHLQYFMSLRDSISQLAKVLRETGGCTIIVQDSHYKEIYNDLPQITTEIAALNGLHLVRRDDFKTGRSMVNLNTKSRSYTGARAITESVISFARSTNASLH